MASEASIGNRALLKLGTSGIASLTDSSEEAKAVNACYDDLRDAELRAHPWKFAIEEFSLGALSETPLYSYLYQYQLPATYLALVEVNDTWGWGDYEAMRWGRGGSGGKAPWRIQGRKILTDMPAPIKIRCVERVTNAGLFEPLFVEALACKIAHEICPRLVQSDAAKDRLLRDYQMAIREARRVDVIERSPEPFPEHSWITGRV